MSTTLSLPVISIEPYINRDDSSPANIADRQRTSKALHEACRDVGFFYLDVSSFVDIENEGSEGKELMRLARAFFGLEQEQKDTISIRNQDNARGYQRLKENVTRGKADNHEAIDFYAPVENPDKTKLLWGENQWPNEDLVPGFRKAYEAWIEKMKSLGMIVMEA
ncbi:hypothetical protein FRC02_012279 [Tulasnella sp. 418]|nr:hypothetical protein FRC02_012279 [Tulasnella sp. 418]